MWVDSEHRFELNKYVLEKAKAIPESKNAPCAVRKEMPIDIAPAHALLKACGIARLTVMQYGQKTDFSNKLVEWALMNVRGSVCVCV